LVDAAWWRDDERVTGDADPGVTAEPPVRMSLRVIWLVGLVYLVASNTHPGLHGRHLAALLLTGSTGAGWACWSVARQRQHVALTFIGIVVMAVSGGLLVVLSPVGVAVVGIAGLCAASFLELTAAALLTSTGPAAALGVCLVGSDPLGWALGAASGGLAGLTIGASRRQQHLRARQDVELALARQRSEVERSRAEVLLERNRIAREVHDVLAHTLSALAVQMEALGSLVAEGADQADIEHAVVNSRRLAVDGLQETRRAVQVLRDEPVDLARHVVELAGMQGADCHVDDDLPEVDTPTGLNVLRVAQEALTNARKHGGTAPVAVALTREGPALVLEVTNSLGAVPSALHATGGGFGLRGMTERIELLGGILTAGPQDGNWLVRAEVPL
jgi:signal transduction histidine kinase